MRLLDKLLGRDRGAADHVRGDEPPAEVHAAAEDRPAAAESEPTLPPEPQQPR